MSLPIPHGYGLTFVLLLSLPYCTSLCWKCLGGCPLSRMQFPDDKEKRFYEWWLSKLGVNVTKTPERRRDVRIFMQYGMPVIIVLLGVLLQVVIGVNPLIRLP